MLVVITGRKGGVGKSVVALHLAAALSDLMGRTALVDLDQANATILDYRDAGLPLTITNADGWDAGLNREPWGAVVVDTYARPNRAQLDELAALADLLVLPTNANADSLRVLARTLPDVRASGANYRVLLNAVPPRPSRALDLARRDLAAGGVPMFDTFIPRRAAFDRAARSLSLAWNVPGGRQLELTFDSLAREVVAHAQAEA